MSNITAISCRAGHFQFSRDRIFHFLNEMFSDKNIFRKFQFIWNESGITNKYSVIPDFDLDCNEPLLYKKTDVLPTTSVRMQVYKSEAVKLGLLVAQESIKKANIRVNEITHLITVSCTGMCAPGLELLLAHELQLDSKVKKHAINFMGCYAAFHGLRLGDIIVKDNPQSQVLIVCVELCSLHLRNDKSDDNLLSLTLFSDGGSACIMQGGAIAGPYLECVDFNSDWIPDSSSEMGWDIGDQGFEMILKRTIPDFIERNIKYCFDQLLVKNKLLKSQITTYAIHPGGKNILNSFCKALHLDQDELGISFNILKEFGNMSSATILFVLQQVLERSIKSNGSQMVYAAAFGPGITVESALFKHMNSNHG